jgi:hypothetical protein
MHGFEDARKMKGIAKAHHGSEIIDWAYGPFVWQSNQQPPCNNLGFDRDLAKQCSGIVPHRMHFVREVDPW